MYREDARSDFEKEKQELVQRLELVEGCTQPLGLARDIELFLRTKAGYSELYVYCTDAPWTQDKIITEHLTYLKRDLSEIQPRKQTKPELLLLKRSVINDNIETSETILKGEISGDISIGLDYVFNGTMFIRTLETSKPEQIPLSNPDRPPQFITPIEVLLVSSNIQAYAVKGRPAEIFERSVGNYQADLVR